MQTVFKEYHGDDAGRIAQHSFNGITMLDWGDLEINSRIDREYLLHTCSICRLRNDYSARTFFGYMGFDYTSVGHAGEAIAQVGVEHIMMF